MNVSNAQVATSKKFWESSNFYLFLVLAVGGLFVGFPEGEARNLIAALFSMVGSAGILRNYFKNGPKIDPKQTGTANWWGYIANIFAAIIPNTLPPELFDSLQELASSILGKNWNGVLVSLFSIGTIIYHISTGKTNPPARVAGESAAQA